MNFPRITFARRNALNRSSASSWLRLFCWCFYSWKRQGSIFALWLLPILDWPIPRELKTIMGSDFSCLSPLPASRAYLRMSMRRTCPSRPPKSSSISSKTRPSQGARSSSDGLVCTHLGWWCCPASATTSPPASGSGRSKMGRSSRPSLRKFGKR